ncbi:MAG TPA: hypothetical protein VHE56_07155 [Mycobacteriales bacterium]|nr:hypothetical protein [Mycobacteriales bacterium]
MRLRAIAPGAAVVVAGGALAATSAFAHTGSATSSTVKTRTVSTFGKILTNGKGWTLYLYSHDTKGHSHCNGACAKEWRPQIVAKGESVHSSVSGIGTIKRKDGRRQVALHGKALYVYTGDTGPGQSHGQNEDGAWHVATPSGPSHATAPTPAPTQSTPSGGGYGY